MKTLPFLAVLFALTACGRADTPAPPHIEVVASPDGGDLVRIVPSRQDGDMAKAEVMRFDGVTGSYTKTAAFALRNPIEPARTVITNGGGFIVTFDDWGQIGRTRNVVVVYRGDGQFVRAWSLHDIFPAEEIEEFVRSVSSTWWRGEVTLMSDLSGSPVVLIAPYVDRMGNGKGRTVGRWLIFNIKAGTFSKRW